MLMQLDEEIKCNKISQKMACDKRSLAELKLTDLQPGYYDVYKINIRNSMYGRFKLFINFNEKVSTVTSNKILDEIIPIIGIQENPDNLPVAQLHILQRKRDHNRNLIVNVELI